MNSDCCERLGNADRSLSGLSHFCIHETGVCIQYIQ